MTYLALLIPAESTTILSAACRQKAEPAGYQNLSVSQNNNRHSQKNLYFYILLFFIDISKLGRSTIRRKISLKERETSNKQLTVNSLPFVCECLSRSFRKEVIQPQVLLQLPCYDFTPIMNHTVDACPLAVSSTSSSTAHFRDVTGGVYKTRERIHRSMLICDY
jgi:hypothetical protein